MKQLNNLKNPKQHITDLNLIEKPVFENKRRTLNKIWATPLIVCLPLPLHAQSTVIATTTPTADLVTSFYDDNLEGIVTTFNNNSEINQGLMAKAGEYLSNAIIPQANAGSLSTFDVNQLLVITDGTQENIERVEMSFMIGASESFSELLKVTSSSTFSVGRTVTLDNNFADCTDQVTFTVMSVSNSALQFSFEFVLHEYTITGVGSIPPDTGIVDNGRLRCGGDLFPR